MGNRQGVRSFRAITEIAALEGGALPVSGVISLDVNGETKQKGDLSELIWNCAEVVSVLSTHYELVAGDLIYTGTPSGVGPVTPGDRIVGRVRNLSDIEITIGEPR